MQHADKQRIYLVGVPLIRRDKEFIQDFQQKSATEKCDFLINVFKEAVNEISGKDPGYDGIIIAMREYAIEGKNGEAVTAEEKAEILKKFENFIAEDDHRKVTIITGGIPYYHNLKKNTDDVRYQKKIETIENSYTTLENKYPELKNDLKYNAEKNQFKTAKQKNVEIRMLHNKSYTISQDGNGKHSKRSPFNECARLPTLPSTQISYVVYYPGKDYINKPVYDLDLNVTTCYEISFPNLRKPQKDVQSNIEGAVINFLLSDSTILAALDPDIFTAVCQVDSYWGISLVDKNQVSDKNIQLIPYSCNAFSNTGCKLEKLDSNKRFECHLQKDSYTIYSDSPILMAILYGTDQTLASLLADSKTDVNQVYGGSKSLLHIVAEKGDTDKLKILLSCNNIKVDHVEGNGNTALLLSVKGGRFDMVQALLAKGASANVLDSNGNTPLLLAVKNGRIDMVQDLLAKGANTNVVDGDSLTPLHYAAALGHDNIALALLQAGANANAYNTGGSTPLHLAVHNNHFNVVQGLLDHGADVNAFTLKENKATSLHFAVQNGRLDIIQALLKKGAYVYAQDNQGCSPMYLAEVKSDNNKIPILQALNKYLLINLYAEMRSSHARQSESTGIVDNFFHFFKSNDQIEKIKVIGELLDVINGNGNKTTFDKKHSKIIKDDEQLGNIYRNYFR